MNKPEPNRDKAKAKILGTVRAKAHPRSGSRTGFR